MGGVWPHNFFKFLEGSSDLLRETRGVEHERAATSGTADRSTMDPLSVLWAGHSSTRPCAREVSALWGDSS